MQIQTPNIILFFLLQRANIKNVHNYNIDKGVGNHTIALHSL